MKYSSLDTIPYKLFVKISQTNDYSLLSDEETDISVLKSIWEGMYNEHLSSNQTDDSKKVFRISKDVENLLSLNRIVLMACESLRFEFNDDLIVFLKNIGYQFDNEDTETYYDSLGRIEREANAYIIKAENFKDMLPKGVDSESKHNVDDVMASYCVILGFNIGDFNTLTYRAFYGFEKSVTSKIKAMNQNNR